MDLGLLLDMAVEGFGDRVLVGSRVDGTTSTRLQALAWGAAREVADRSASAVIYLADSGLPFHVAMFASGYGHVPVVPLNYRLGDQQLAALVARHPDAIAVSADRHRGLLERAGLPVLSPREWLGAAEARAGEPPSQRSDPDAPAAVIYTSGTTAAPKGVLLRHEHLVSYVLGSVELGAAEPSEAALVSVPPYHIAGVANAISNLYAGRRVVAIGRFSPVEWLRTVQDEHITSAMVVPTMLARILDADGVASVPQLATLAYGGAPMPTAIIARALSTWPHVGFVNAYGLTETSSTITVLGPEDHRSALASREPERRDRLRSVGRALPGVELEIRDSSGAVVALGTAGRIFVRGPQVSAEYAESGSQLDAAGFFDTGDGGYLDRDGYLFLAGRLDDTIIRGAENIAPAEIEDVLLGHSAVRDVAVVGVPDDEWGQRIEAVIVLRPGTMVAPGELDALVRSALRASKTPDRFHVWTDLPRTETGKLLRREVIRQLALSAEAR